MTVHRLTRGSLEIWRFALFLGVSLWTCGFAFTQANHRPQVPARDLAEKEKGKETTLRGCLGARPGMYYDLVADEGGWYYLLKGNTSILDKFAGKEISVRGYEDGSLPHAFRVTGLSEVFDTPCPAFKPSLSHTAWHTEENRKYGIKFAYPDDLQRAAPPEPGVVEGNFVTDQKVMAVAHLTIPAKIYPDSNFGGGSFAIFVNPEIGNDPSCRQFGFSDPEFTSTHVIGGIHYSEAQRDGIAAGSSSASRYFHTFQNGLCYELYFEFWEGSPANIERKVRVVQEKDQISLIESLIAGVNFFRPATAPQKERNPRAAPRVTQFAASTQTADDATNRGQITFSWTTQDADYVELSYQCPPPPAPPAPPEVVIVEHGFPWSCENASPVFKSGAVQSRTPNGSATIGFGNYHRIDPISIIVRLTPFSHGKAYPDSAKSISIQIDPHNPFPEGVPAANGRVVVSYPVSADGTTTLKQGSSLTVRWTDTVPGDPCVNLYLVQDDGRGGQTYRLQLGGQCFMPASGGSYTWTIPVKYSGSGFRIYSRAPGGGPSGLGPPFSIERAAAAPKPGGL